MIIEIDVTDAMIQAGVQAMADTTKMRLNDRLEVVFRAMYAARPKPQLTPSHELADIVSTKGWNR